MHATKTPKGASSTTWRPFHQDSELAPFDAVIRVSRRNGRDGDSFMSPTEQREAIERAAAAQGIRIVLWHDETDSVSGGTVERKGLQAAIRRVQQGKVRGLFVAKVDRFSRTVQGGLSAINTLEDCGGELRSAREGVIVGDEKATATDRLIRTFWLMLAQWQRDTLTEGWDAVTERRVDRGITTTAPYGMVKDETTRLLVANPDEIEWVVEMFERRAKGTSWGAIADWLNDSNAKTRNGGGWSLGTVRQIVTNRTYLGEVRSGDRVNESAHDAVIDRDLWERANNATKTTGKRNGERRAPEQYMLSGLVRCAGCGGRMKGRSEVRTNKSGERMYRYYRCQRRYSYGKCNAPATVDAAALEELVDAVFRNTFLTDATAIPTENTDDLDAAETELRRAESDLSDFLSSPATAELKETLGQEWVDEGVRTRMARVVAAREDVAAVRNGIFGVALPSGLADVWSTLDVEERRGFLSDGLGVVAVARGKSDDVSNRVRVWTRRDPTRPDGLPGIENRGVGLTPITFNAPRGTGVAAA